MAEKDWITSTLPDESQTFDYIKYVFVRSRLIVKSYKVLKTLVWYMHIFAQLLKKCWNTFFQHFFKNVQIFKVEFKY